MATGSTEIGQECDLWRHETSCAELHVFRESPREISRWSSYKLSARGVTGSSTPGAGRPLPSAGLGPRPARHALGASAAATRPAQRRPRNRSSPGATGRDAIRGTRPGRGRGAASRVRPGRARRGLPFPPRPQETSRNRGGKSPTPPSRLADPSHLDLPTPLSPMMRIFRVVSTSSSILTLLRTASSWPPLPLLSPSPRGELPRMRPAPPGATFLSHRVFRFCRGPGRPSSAWR